MIIRTKLNNPVLNRKWLRVLLAGPRNTLIRQWALVMLLFRRPLGSASFASQSLHACRGNRSGRVGMFQWKGGQGANADVLIISWLVQWQALRLIHGVGLGWTRATAQLVASVVALPYLKQRKLVIQ